MTLIPNTTRLPTEPSLTAEIARELLRYEPETGKFYWREWHGFRGASNWSRRRAGRETGRARSHGYLMIRILDRTYLVHRVAWLISHGKWPDHQIDHLNGDRTDNRLSNLREVTSSINQRNKGMDTRNKSGVTGVSSVLSGNWKASIRVNRRSIHLGTYKSFEEAVAARRQAESQYGFGPDHGVRLPYIDETQALYRASRAGKPACPSAAPAEQGGPSPIPPISECRSARLSLKDSEGEGV